MVTGKDAEPGRRTSLELDLHRDKDAPSIARAAVAGLCERVELTSARCQMLLLLVSEIVTNAVVHSNAPPGTPIRFRADADAVRVRVDVHDAGHVFTHSSLATAHQRRSGWGLRLVEREARRWGVQHHDGTLVWFELALDPCVCAGASA